MRSVFVVILLLTQLKSNCQYFQLVEYGNCSVNSTIETNDSGFLLPVNNGNRNVIDFIKLNTNLDKLFKISLSYPAKAQIGVHSIAQLADGTILVGGSTQLLDSAFADAYLLFLNPCYEPERFIIFNDNTEINYIQEIFCNSSSKDTYTIRIDGLNSSHNGDAMFFIDSKNLKDSVLSNKNTFRIDAYWGNSQTSKNGGLYFVGGTYRRSLNSVLKNQKVLFVKVDTNKNLYWEKLFILNDTNRYYSGAGFSFMDADESKLLCLADDRQPNKKTWYIRDCATIIKADTAGNIYWKKTISDTTHNEVPIGMAKIDDNRYTVTVDYYPLDTQAVENPAQTYGKIYLIDSNANVIDTGYAGKTTVIFNKTYISTIAQTTLITKDKKIFIAGHTRNKTKFNDYEYDAFATKLNADLTVGTKVLDTFKYDTQCTKTLKDTTYTLPAPEIITVILDSFYYTPVKSENWTLSVIPQLGPSTVEVKAYPNPFNTGVTLETEQVATVIVCNILGETLSRQQLEAGTHSLNTESLAPGVYFIKITCADGRTGTAKLLKELR